MYSLFREECMFPTTMRSGSEGARMSEVDESDL